MFSVGEYIVYSGNGVCRVEAIGTMDIEGISKDRQFYTLIPVFSTGKTVFVPVDNKKVVMRPVISKEEAELLVKDIKSVEPLWIRDDKKRENAYKECMRECNINSLVGMIKAIHLRTRERLEEGKHAIASDERYEKAAKEFFYGELAIALNMDKDKVEDYINKTVEEK